MEDELLAKVPENKRKIVLVTSVFTRQLLPYHDALERDILYGTGELDGLADLNTLSNCIKDMEGNPQEVHEFRLQQSLLARGYSEAEATAASLHDHDFFFSRYEQLMEEYL